MPAPFGRSSTGCSMSPAPCWKIERCLTRHSGSRRTQLRDTPGYCAGDELHHLLFAAHRRNDWQQRRPGGGPCQGRQPPKARVIASLYRAPPGPHSAADIDKRFVARSCSRNCPEKIPRGARKTHLQKGGESGSSRESFAHSGVAMDNPGCWQSMAREESVESNPIQSASAPRQPSPPDPPNLIGVPA
jgi:hypothetical protein